MSRFDIAPERRATGSPLLRFTQGLGKVLIATLTEAEIHGYEHVPDEGPVLFAANHTHIVDGPLLYAALRRPVVFYVKAEAFIGPLDIFLRRIGQIPVHRGVAERGPLVAALETLEAGGAVGVFPEGTRGSGDVASVRHGIAYLAVRSGAPVIPIVCTGSDRIIAPRLPWRRTPVRITFGEPLQVSAGTGASRSRVAAAAEEIRASMATLLQDST